MSAQRSAPRREPRIAIVGAGVAGLSTAWFLKRRGYKDVIVLEKLGRVGGLCKSITDGYMSFDLGGTYLSPSYRETLKLARAVRAERYRGKDYEFAFNVKEGGKDRIRYRSPMAYVREDPERPRTKVPIWRIAVALLKFAWLRHRVRRFVDAPTFAGVENCPDICVYFSDWLEKNGLGVLFRKFEIPVTMMGYGFLGEVPAPYVLKYMAPGTYWAMVARAIPLVRRLSPWPQRFELGFQRMWEQIAWRLDVRVDVEVRRIRRCEDRQDLPIEIDLSFPDRVFDHDVAPYGETLCFDRVIIACPLTLDVLGGFFRRGSWKPAEREQRKVDESEMTLVKEEMELFSKIKRFTYCQTTLHAVTLEGDVEIPFKLRKPVVPVLPFNEKTVGKPWTVVQVWEQASRLLQVYSRVDTESEKSEEQTRNEVIANVEALLARMGAQPAGSSPRRKMLRRWRTYDRWPYFGHVGPEEFRSGFYTKLEALQGQRYTYYTGGATTFEMVESIIRHAKHIAALVDEDLRRRFPARHRATLEPAPPDMVQPEAL